MHNIRMFKLITGDDILADSSFHTDSRKWILKKAVRVVFAPQGLALLPYDTFYQEDHLAIREDHVVFQGEVSEEIYNAYNQKFGSGLVLPNPGLKLVGVDDDE